MKKRTPRPKVKQNIKTLVTEEDLLKNFHDYQKVIEDLASQFSILPSEVPQETPQPTYVSEPVFFYQVHASI